ncbi:MAG: hypothetical protein IPI73_20280 [Betaproteobacteria bacterium]|nr:hypothetical protein [Betaproteobacteria bacterium]
MSAPWAGTRRLLLLLGCIALGTVIGWGGFAITGAVAWFLAIPAAIAAGWLVVADPTRCETDIEKKGAGSRPRKP